MFFFEKKNQKTFANGVQSLAQAVVSDSGRKEQKFFGSFFQKRTPSFLALSETLFAPSETTKPGALRDGARTQRLVVFEPAGLCPVTPAPRLRKG